MIRDLADYSRWTEQYKNDPLGSANNKINDAYLKHNGQTAGVNSYNDVAELLIAFEMRKWRGENTYCLQVESPVKNVNLKIWKTPTITLRFAVNFPLRIVAKYDTINL